MMSHPPGEYCWVGWMGFGAEEVYHNLKSVIKKKYGQDACNVGDEGRQSYSKILDVFHV